VDTPNTYIYCTPLCTYNIMPLTIEYIYKICYSFYLITWRSLDYMESLAAMVFYTFMYDLVK
jgi:hypothetical protein